MNKIIPVSAGAFLIIIAILIDGKGRQEKLLQNRIDSISNKCDSISSELYYYETELNRYEIAYKIFLRRNPKAAAQYGDIISEETE